VLRQLAEPRSCTEVAARLHQTQQRVDYHVKRLVEHGLVTQVAERRVRGINEGTYQATARLLVGRIGKRQQRDEASLGYLLDLMEVQSDVAALHSQAADRAAGRPAAEPDLPSLGVSGEIRVRSAAWPNCAATTRSRTGAPDGSRSTSTACRTDS
jgi:hypothetical protein